MTIQYDSNGLVIQTLSEILDERENKCKTILGDDFVISGESVVANLQTADADREFSLQELLLFIANQLDPDQVEGIWLDYICALNNITRYKATKSTIPITVTGTAGTSKNTGEITIVDDTTDEYYINTGNFVIGSNGTVDVTFEATSYGPITTLSSHTFSLKTPSIGISSVAYNTSGTATTGRNTETDIELRLRREDTLEYSASSILSSIRANVKNVENVEYINAYENDTMATVSGIPAKAFEIVVQGGDNTAIAKAILEKKPTGIQAYGSTTVTVSDDDGNNFSIGFTRPTQIPVDITLTFNATGTQTEAWKTALKEELVTTFNSLYTVGSTVYIYNLYCVLNAHSEITNVTNFQVKKHSESVYSDSVAIGNRELATLDVANITITQSV